jgi:hypothetical protein
MIIDVPARLEGMGPDGVAVPETKWTSVWSPAGLTTGCSGRCSAASFRFNLVRAPCLSLSWTSYRGRLSPSPLLMTSASEMSRCHWTPFIGRVTRGPAWSHPCDVRQIHPLPDTEGPRLAQAGRRLLSPRRSPFPQQPTTTAPSRSREFRGQVPGGPGPRRAQTNGAGTGVPTRPVALGKLNLLLALLGC